MAEEAATTGDAPETAPVETTVPAETEPVAPVEPDPTVVPPTDTWAEPTPAAGEDKPDALKYDPSPTSPVDETTPRTGNVSTLPNADLKTLLETPTVTGKDGISRVAGPAYSNWEPAPMESSDKEKADLEAFNVAVDAAAEAKL